MQFWDMSTTIRNKKDLTKLKKDLHGKDSDRLLNIDETGYQYVLTSTVMRIGAESRNRPYKFQYTVQPHNLT